MKFWGFIPTMCYIYALLKFWVPGIKIQTMSLEDALNLQYKSLTNFIAEKLLEVIRSSCTKLTNRGKVWIFLVGCWGWSWDMPPWNVKELHAIFLTHRSSSLCPSTSVVDMCHRVAVDEQRTQKTADFLNHTNLQQINLLQYL